MQHAHRFLRRQKQRNATVTDRAVGVRSASVGQGRAERRNANVLRGNQRGRPLRHAGLHRGRRAIGCRGFGLRSVCLPLFNRCRSVGGRNVRDDVHIITAL
ncbi:hypothetical protein SDC9_136314 [bioreactor metagenome]|uniref:Uncharacterized protein n=1 Tax=bioreactor metagenome TaxID=1076179 RepID=A0A645DIS3_9ZZZZ